MQIRRRVARRRGRSMHTQPDFPAEDRKIRRSYTRTCGHPQKEAVSGVCSEQDDKRFRFGLGRPRAAAHGWGKVARIRTEINRLPQSDPVSPGQNRAHSRPLHAASQLASSLGPGRVASRPLPLLQIRRNWGPIRCTSQARSGQVVPCQGRLATRRLLVVQLAQRPVQVQFLLGQQS